ncbi:MAG: hemerythrin domain-containing protein [Deltaproteobacteria bacterium]|nr:hemerythrin domain-containing protein [Deltaproteobacteria bacterium]
MDIFEQLKREHGLILDVMDAFDAYAQGLLAGSEDQHGLSPFIVFVSDYMDGLHHAAEEKILFRAMNEHGFAAEVGPISVMLREHDSGRSFTETLAAMEAANASWTGVSRARAAHAIAALSGLLRAHIAQEERMLYPLACQALPEHALRAINAEGERLVREQGPLRLELERLGLELCGRFTPKAASVA